MPNFFRYLLTNRQRKGVESSTSANRGAGRVVSYVRNNFHFARQGCKVLRSTCLCVSVSPIAYLKNNTSKFHQMFRTCYTSVAVARSSSDDDACDTLYTSGFADDFTLSHNGANGPESKTTRIFRPVCQMASPGGGGGKVCCLSLRLVFLRKKSRFFKRFRFSERLFRFRFSELFMPATTHATTIGGGNR